MSRRTGQKGHIEPSGRWWVVRWWMDVPEQEERRHMRERICSISGPGTLSKSERKRRSREIVVESGADTKEYFQKVVKKKGGSTTFREEAQRWFNHVQNRRRKPIAVSTLELVGRLSQKLDQPEYRRFALVRSQQRGPEVTGCEDGGTWSVAQVHRHLFASREDGWLLPSTTKGEEIYPRKWNNEFIDMLIVEEERQNTPTLSSE